MQEDHLVAVVRGQVRAAITQMPLAEHRRRVAGRLESLGNCDFVGRDTADTVGEAEGVDREPGEGARREEHRVNEPPRGIAPGQQAEPGRGTDGTRGIEASQANALFGQGVDVRGADCARAES